MATRTIHPFPARMAPDIVLSLVDGIEKTGSQTILDPMCGSGTVLAAAISHGHKAIGFDMDPLAILMTRVTTEPISIEQFLGHRDEVMRRAAQITSTMPPWVDSETNEFAEFWFGKQQRIALSRLAVSIQSVKHVRIQRALQVALSRIIITKTPKASLAADTSHSRPHRVTKVSDYDVFEGFARSTDELAKLLAARKLCGESVVGIGDSRDLRSVGDKSIDLTITSPPYLNAIDYLRGHRLALIWFGYSISQLRQIRAHSIGTERSLESMSDEVTSIIENLRSSVAFPTRLPVGIIARYAHDVCAFARETHRVLRSGGKIVTVLGNSTLKGNFITNDAIVEQALVNAGFKIEHRTERELPANRRYMPITSVDPESKLTKRMHTEVVLIATRP